LSTKGTAKIIHQSGDGYFSAHLDDSMVLVK